MVPEEFEVTLFHDDFLASLDTRETLAVSDSEEKSEGCCVGYITEATYEPEDTELVSVVA